MTRTARELEVQGEMKNTWWLALLCKWHKIQFWTMKKDPPQGTGPAHAEMK